MFNSELISGKSSRWGWTNWFALVARSQAASWCIHVGLLLTTLITTTAFGTSVVQTFAAHRLLSADDLFSGYVQIWNGQWNFFEGLWFSIPLLLILGAHEAGHYVAARRLRVDVSAPFFLPSPLLLGTFGAFIRIRAPIYRRRDLFDIGIAGPIAGFVVLLPFLLTGLLFSHRAYVGSTEGAVGFGSPLLVRLVTHLDFGTHAGVLAWHPFAMAAWAGLLATAMNLLPMGQLDGGHILYAVFGDRWHRVASLVFIGILVLAGFFYYSWWGWAAVMFLFGRRHPLVYDQSPLGAPRIILALLSVVILVLSFCVVPVSIR